tara:strand:+ start:98 stop:937 length:840 start_codon:yes stop_codon:yes gene_type:complete
MTQINNDDFNKENNHKLDIHQNIYQKLDYFLKIKKIPNIIFHGPNGAGKKTIVNNLIKNIYNNDYNLINNYTLYVNCALGKGIKFIREDIKFFAKTNIDTDNGRIFKTIILLNADYLTSDAQSAMRRCIELFSYNTRFFIITNNKSKLLKPILSRFSEIYIHYPIIKGKHINLHTYNLNSLLSNNINKAKFSWIKKNINKINNDNIFDYIDKLYNKCYSGNDIVDYIQSINIDDKSKYFFLVYYEKVKREFRNEKLLLLLTINFLINRSNVNLENIYFI